MDISHKTAYKLTQTTVQLYGGRFGQFPGFACKFVFDIAVEAIANLAQMRKIVFILRPKFLAIDRSSMSQT